MKAHKSTKNKEKSFSRTNSESNNHEQGTFQFEDNRPASIAQREIQDLADNSPQVKKTAQLQAIANKGTPRIIQKEENNTGLPDNLKSGVENLSGQSLDDVKVHRNSDKPASLQAHAYAQGTDIHLASGQEKHLPHEAWHVAQQKQGRVKPTMQSNGVNINDNVGLEKEADVMGGKAVQMVENGINTRKKSTKIDPIIQRISKIQLTEKEAAFFNGKAKHWYEGLGADSKKIINLDSLLDQASSWINFYTLISILRGGLDSPPLGFNTKGFITGEIAKFKANNQPAVTPAGKGAWGTPALPSSDKIELGFTSSIASMPGVEGVESADQDWGELQSKVLSQSSKPVGFTFDKGDPEQTSEDTTEVTIAAMGNDKVYQFVLHYHPAEEGNYLHFKNKREGDKNLICAWAHWLLKGLSITRESLQKKEA